MHPALIYNNVMTTLNYIMFFLLLAVCIWILILLGKRHTAINHMNKPLAQQYDAKSKKAFALMILVIVFWIILTGINCLVIYKLHPEWDDIIVQSILG